MLASDARSRKDDERYLDQQQTMMEEEGVSFSGFERDFLALNRQGGKFLDVSGISGADALTDGRAGVFADFDDDGDPDLFLHNYNEPANQLFRNDLGAPHWLRVSLRGTESGTDAFGARVILHGAGKPLTRLKHGGSAYMSQHDPRLLFGLGAADRVEAIDVRWPSGRVERFPGTPADRSVRLVEGSGRVEELPSRAFSLPDPSPEAAWRHLKGQPLPDVPVLLADGTRTTLRAAARPGLVSVWASWCPSCAVELEDLEALRGVPVLALSVDGAERAEHAFAFARRRRVTFPVAVAEPAALEGWLRTPGVPVPLLFAVGKDGRVEEVFEGWSPETQRRVRRWSP